MQIQASSTSTTITVNKPDDYTFCAYKGNTLTSWANPGTFANDFVELTTTALVNQYTSFTGIKPGKTLLFCTKISNPSSVNLTVTKFISNNSSKQGLTQARKLCGGSKLMNIGWAMNIYVGASSNGVAVNTSSTNLGYQNIFNNPTGTFGTTNGNSGAGLTDLFNYSSTDTFLDNAGDANHKITRDVELYDEDNLSGDYLYLYYSVVFDDTVVYAEYDDSNATRELDYIPTSGDRWFMANGNNMTSNCFGGLSFALTDISLTI